MQFTLVPRTVTQEACIPTDGCLTISITGAFTADPPDPTAGFLTDLRFQGQLTVLSPQLAVLGSAPISGPLNGNNFSLAGDVLSYAFYPAYGFGPQGVGQRQAPGDAYWTLCS